MAVVIRCVGGPYDGQYLEAYDPDWVPDPDYQGPTCGLATWTPDPALARQFTTGGEAYDLWRQQATRFPTRPDGKPNRPLTAYTIEVLALSHVEQQPADDLPDRSAQVVKRRLIAQKMHRSARRRQLAQQRAQREAEANRPGEQP